MKTKLGLIFGGMSTENEVSVMSANSILQNLSKEKVNAKLGMVRGKMDKLNHATDNASSLAPTPQKTNHSANFSNLSKQNDTRMGR